MSTRTTPTRTVDFTVLTTAGFITAQLKMLAKGLVVEQLDAVEEFYDLANASLVGEETAVDFFALQRDAVVFWVPKGEPDEMLQRAIQPSQQGRVHVLFDGGVLVGDLVWREHVRLAKFVTNQDGYILLRNVAIEMPMLGEKREARAVVLNVNHVVGISTEAPM